MSYYPHHVLLHAIVEEILVTRDAMGFVTHIGKVRAYAGVQGNELADAAAQRA